MDGRLRAAVNRAHASRDPTDTTGRPNRSQPCCKSEKSKLSRDEGQRGFQAAGRMNSYRPGRHRGLTSTWRRSVSWHCLDVCCKALPNVIVPSLRGVRTVGRDIEVGVSIPLRMRHVPGSGDPLLRDVVDETKAWETRQGGYECVPGRHPLGRRGPLRAPGTHYIHGSGREAVSDPLVEGRRRRLHIGWCVSVIIRAPRYKDNAGRVGNHVVVDAIDECYLPRRPRVHVAGAANATRPCVSPPQNRRGRLHKPCKRRKRASTRRNRIPEDDHALRWRGDRLNQTR